MANLDVLWWYMALPNAYHFTPAIELPNAYHFTPAIELPNAYHFTPLPQRLELTAVTHSATYTPGRRRTETHLHLSQTVNAPQAMKTAFVPEEGLQRCHYYRYIMPLWYSRCHVFTLRMSIERQLCGRNSRFARALPH